MYVSYTRFTCYVVLMHDSKEICTRTQVSTFECQLRAELYRRLYIVDQGCYTYTIHTYIYNTVTLHICTHAIYYNSEQKKVTFCNRLSTCLSNT